MQWKMNEDKLSDVQTDGCARAGGALRAALRRCRQVRARCAASSCVSICSKTFLVSVNFVFLVSLLYHLTYVRINLTHLSKKLQKSESETISPCSLEGTFTQRWLG